MAKDDYDVLVFKILTYLYACMKRKILFDGDVFAKAICMKDISEEYLADVLRMMQEEGLLEGIVAKKIWGGAYILISDLPDAHITAQGIRYLKDNGKMREVKEHLSQTADLVGSLAAFIKL